MERISKRMNHVHVADVTNGQSTHTEKHPEGDWVREEKTGRALVRVKVAEPRVTLSSHSVSFSINRVNTEDDLGHGEKEKHVR